MFRSLSSVIDGRPSESCLAVLANNEMTRNKLSKIRITFLWVMMLVILEMDLTSTKTKQNRTALRTLTNDWPKLMRCLTEMKPREKRGQSNRLCHKPLALTSRARNKRCPVEVLMPPGRSSRINTSWSGNRLQLTIITRSRVKKFSSALPRDSHSRTRHLARCLSLPYGRRTIADMIMRTPTVAK